MNQLSSKQRKLLYLVGITILMVPIIWLGRPATGDDADSGGRLAQLRAEYKIGEAGLGNVDPSSATMNLLLLGMRGIAVSVLWQQADEQKDTKNWAQMRTTVDSIILLQPHYKKVWQFQGWNLAFNVSAEWDAVADRYYWVKEGGKFLMKGTRRNTLYPELYWDTGDVWGRKVGRSDEWRFFRKYFLKDPDEATFKGGPDTEINPEEKDNYLVAKEWFYQANRVEDSHPQHDRMRMIFRSYPARAQFDYADALQREGRFEEESQIAWQIGEKMWTEEFGKEEWVSTHDDIVFFLEVDDQNVDIRELVAINNRNRADKNKVSESDVRRWIDGNQKIVNYRYWRTRAISESEPETTEAHRELYEGRQLFKAGKMREASERLMSGMAKFEALLDRYPTLKHEDSMIEEGLMAVLYWQHILQLTGAQVPEEFPLFELWTTRQDRIPAVNSEFRRELSMQSE